MKNSKSADYNYFAKFTEKRIKNPDYSGYITGFVSVFVVGNKGRSVKEFPVLTENAREFYEFVEKWKMIDALSMKEIAREQLDKIEQTIKERFWSPK